MGFSQREATACITRCDFPACRAKHTEYVWHGGEGYEPNIDLPQGWAIVRDIALCAEHAHLKDALLLMLEVQYRALAVSEPAA